jgi:NADH-quinone oxidoreductase subunit E
MDSSEVAHVISEDIRRELEAELEYCLTRRAACIEAMQIVQRYSGWLSDESIRDISEFLGMTCDELDGVATFYNHIYRKPVGRHVILICDSVTCWITRYDGILDHLKARLGIDLGETTQDGRFTMLPIQCLGACDHAPALMIDEELYTDLDPEKCDTILEHYK